MECEHKHTAVLGDLSRLCSCKSWMSKWYPFPGMERRAARVPHKYSQSQMRKCGAAAASEICKKLPYFVIISSASFPDTLIRRNTWSISNPAAASTINCKKCRDMLPGITSPGYRDFSIFQDGGRSPSWICLRRKWTTNEGYLVFIITQNLVAIDAVVSIIWKFQYLACLAWKRPFTPKKCFWRFSKW